MSGEGLIAMDQAFGADLTDMAVYRPATREVMLVMSGSYSVLSEAEAEWAVKAIQEALAVRDHARAMLGEQTIRGMSPSHVIVDELGCGE